MGHALGVLAMEHIAVGLVEHDRLAGSVRLYPPDASVAGALQSLPAEQIAEAICAEIRALAGGQPVSAIGVGFPGIIRDGVVEESPNLQHVKGFHLGRAISAAFDGTPRVLILNDADAIAAGIAATRGHLRTLVRVWTLGSGVGYGRYPWLQAPARGATWW